VSDNNEQRLILYYRTGCHLCEDMLNELLAVLAQRQKVTLDVREVDQTDQWLILYGERVPVLIGGKQVISEYFLDMSRLLQYLDGQSVCH